MYFYMMKGLMKFIWKMVLLLKALKYFMLLKVFIKNDNCQYYEKGDPVISDETNLI